MPQIGDVDDLKEASFMALSSPSSTIEAKRFVDAIVLQIKANETRARARSAKGEEQFTKTVGLILGDLLLTHDKGNRDKTKLTIMAFPTIQRHLTALVKPMWVTLCSKTLCTPSKI